MEIRRLGRQDLPSLLKLYAQLDPEDRPLSLTRAEEVWTRFEQGTDLMCLGAAEGEKVLSACTLMILPNLTRGGRPIGFIENVVTEQSFRRQGLARAVLLKAVEIARERACYKLILQSGISRREAHRLYESLGFNGESKKAFDMRFD